MRVDFYRIEGPAGAVLKNCLQAVAAKPNDESRTVEISGVPFRAQELAQTTKHWAGDIVRIRMNDVPQIVSTNGDTQDLDLDDDQGIGEDTAFHYDERTQVLAIQRNRSGVSASKWGTYFRDFAAEGDPIIPTVIPTEGAMNAIVNKLNVVKKVHVRVAGNVNSVLAIGSRGDTAADIRQLAETTHVVEVTFGMGRGGGAFPIKTARQALKGLYNKAQRAMAGDGATIERIDVIGTFDDESAAKFNLLDYLIVEEVDVPIDPKARRVLYVDRQRGVDEAWARRRDELERRFTRRK